MSRTRWSRSRTSGGAPSRCTRPPASAEAALGRAQSLYDRGQIDLLPLLDAQRARLTVRVGANDSNTQLLLDSVRLYKALGGGWQAFETASRRSASTPKRQYAELCQHDPHPNPDPTRTSRENFSPCGPV